MRHPNFPILMPEVRADYERVLSAMRDVGGDVVGMGWQQEGFYACCWFGFSWVTVYDEPDMERWVIYRAESEDDGEFEDSGSLDKVLEVLRKWGD